MVSNDAKCTKVLYVICEPTVLRNPTDVSYIEDDDIYERIRTYDEGLLNDAFQDVITQAEVIKAIKELKTGKSDRLDLLINEFFGNTCDTLTDKLVILFNIIFSSGHFPLSWVDGVVIPIHKKAVKIQLIIIEASLCLVFWGNFLRVF